MENYIKATVKNFQWRMIYVFVVGILALIYKYFFD